MISDDHMGWFKNKFFQLIFTLACNTNSNFVNIDSDNDDAFTDLHKSPFSSKCYSQIYTVLSAMFLN